MRYHSSVLTLEINMSRTSLIGLGAFFVAVALIFYVQYGFFRGNHVATDDVITLDGEIIETDGVLHSIPLEDIVVGNPQKDGIPAIDDPAYEGVYSADQYLDDNGYGLMVEVNGETRFYPYQILVWHEIVNDTLNGKRLVVTYCPLCFTGVAYERDVDGITYDFGVSGKLYDNNLLMYDRQTDSYWSQALGEVVVGELTGAELTRHPALTMTWKHFRENYGSGSVLSRDTGFSRDYTSDPYEPQGYYTNADVWFPLSNTDDRLYVKDIVFGYQNDVGQKAYPQDVVLDLLLMNDVVGEDAILIFWDPDIEAIRGFSREMEDGEVLEFELLDTILQDKASGSLWNFEGEAVGGAYLGAELVPITLEQAFWFSWVASHPETEVLTINE
jgi:hypothetical protein